MFQLLWQVVYFKQNLWELPIFIKKSKIATKRTGNEPPWDNISAWEHQNSLYTNPGDSKNVCIIVDKPCGNWASRTGPYDFGPCGDLKLPCDLGISTAFLITLTIHMHLPATFLIHVLSQSQPDTTNIIEKYYHSGRTQTLINISAKRNKFSCMHYLCTI